MSEYAYSCGEEINFALGSSSELLLPGNFLPTNSETRTSEKSQNTRNTSLRESVEFQKRYYSYRHTELIDL